MGHGAVNGGVNLAEQTSQDILEVFLGRLSIGIFSIMTEIIVLRETLKMFLKSVLFKRLSAVGISRANWPPANRCSNASFKETSGDTTTGKLLGPDQSCAPGASGRVRHHTNKPTCC